MRSRSARCGSSARSDTRALARCAPSSASCRRHPGVTPPVPVAALEVASASLVNAATVAMPIPVPMASARRRRQADVARDHRVGRGVARPPAPAAARRSRGRALAAGATGTALMVRRSAPAAHASVATSVAPSVATLAPLPRWRPAAASRRDPARVGVACLAPAVHAPGTAAATCGPPPSRAHMPNPGPARALRQSRPPAPRSVGDSTRTLGGARRRRRPACARVEHRADARCAAKPRLRPTRRSTPRRPTSRSG